MPGTVPRGKAGGGGNVIRALGLCAVSLLLSPIALATSAAKSRASDEKSVQVYCQEDVDRFWSTIGLGDSSLDSIVRRIENSSANAWPLDVQDQWMPVPTGRIDVAGASEIDGKLRFLILFDKFDGWRINVSWWENSRASSGYRPKPNQTEKVPRNQVELLSAGIQRIGEPINCHDLPGSSADLVWAEVRLFEVLLTATGSPRVYMIQNNDGVLAEETQFRNADGNKIWEAVMFPETGKKDIVRVEYVFQTSAPVGWKDTPLTVLSSRDRLAPQPAWANQLSDVISSRSADKLRKLGERNGWQVLFPFSKKTENGPPESDQHALPRN